MSEPGRFVPGARVRVRVADPSMHTRAPRYVRGHVGQVVEVHGTHPVPDDVVAAVHPPGHEAVYAVRFDAAGLWTEVTGAATHSVTVNLWDRYLEPAEEGSDVV